MFRNKIRLPFRLLGIPLDLDLSFLVFLPILAWIIGADLDRIAASLPYEVMLPEERPDFVIGLISALGLFGSVVIHELGHSIVARRYGLQVRSITLWLLGGMARFDEMPREKGQEAVIAIAGPLTSFGLAALAYGILRGIPDTTSSVVLFLLGFLVLMNLTLAIFNLVPALPLDGGRVLRSLLALRMNYARATDISVAISSLLAFLLGFLGFLTFNVIWILIAFFVYSAGRSEATMVRVQDALTGLRVDEIMVTDVDTLYGHHSVQEMVGRMLRDRHLGYPVLDIEGNLIGIASISDVQSRQLSDPDLERSRVSDVMRSPAPTVKPETPALEAFERLNEQGITQLAVVDGEGELVGVLSNTDFTREVQLRLLRAGLSHRE